MNIETYTYSETSHQILIEARPEYIHERSNPSLNYFFYAYSITVKNQGKKSCQLLTRHWIIRDGQGKEEHIQGEGVVGLQPVIDPDQSFQYTSFCPLRTSTGNMRGTYEMIDADLNRFKVTIPLFFLRAPSTFH